MHIVNYKELISIIIVIDYLITFYVFLYVDEKRFYNKMRFNIDLTFIEYCIADINCM